MEQPLGSLRPVSATEDRTLFAYRRRPRTARGVAWVSLALLMVAGAVMLTIRMHSWAGWLAAIPCLILASAAAFCGMLDLLNRPMFQIEVDRRARTVALSVPREQGQALLKVRFADVAAVEHRAKGPPPCWGVSLRMRDNRQIGLGVSDDAAESDALAGQFAEWIGVEVKRYNGPP